MILHPDPVAEDCSSRQRAGGIHRHDPNLVALPTVGSHQLVDQRAFAGSRIACDPDHDRTPTGRTQLLQRRDPGRLTVLQQRDQTGDGPDITGLDPDGQRSRVLLAVALGHGLGWRGGWGSAGSNQTSVTLKEGVLAKRAATGRPIRSPPGSTPFRRDRNKVSAPSNSTRISVKGVSLRNASPP